MKKPTKTRVAVSREEWLKQRRHGIGGSDISGIAGISPYSSPYSVWAEKLGLYKKPETQAMFMGTELEQTVANLFVRNTGIKVKKSNFIFTDPEKPYFLANLDRICVGEKAILECKTTSAFNAKAWQDDIIPPYYYAQVQWYMGIMDCPKAYVACLIGGQDFVLRVVEKNDEYINMLRDKAEDFWQINVLGGVQPELTDIDKGIMKDLYPESVPEKVVELPESTADIIAAIEMLEKQEKETKKEKERLQAVLMDSVKDGEEGIIPGFEKKVVCKNKSSQRFSSSDFKKAYPDLYKEFTKESVSRTLEIKEIK